ncbi:hypothetical protein SAMN05421595_2825 [Austwickia chelonae]|uniref:YtxH domain-containing protein n=1 Tax=Austwickia chelonae NBRC 105200 TaxID=1184607 RepID=K6W9Q2_9MICO|nr:hypothetical protein [Austwickia chelonae]GAB78547.1 hypothetical protein AUCHE_11_00060 [Austwickia chelonae NBRC 105200]SEW40664.1 hypothetical protein SAMN05421595_2825 [Austwickia chelonae]
MRGRLLFIAGLGVGYLLGARAGRSQYEKIMSQADALWNDARVQEKVEQAQTLATDAASTAGAAVVDKAKEKAPEVAATLTGMAETAKEKISDLGHDSGSGEEPARPTETGIPATPPGRQVDTDAPWTTDTYGETRASRAQARNGWNPAAPDASSRKPE